MNNKPSLYDIEAFNKARDQEQEDECSQIERESQLLEYSENKPREAEFQKVIDSQKNNIDKISEELEQSKRLQETYKQLLLKQQNEIITLRNKLGKQLDAKTDAGESLINDSNNAYNYNLILRNIVMLIEDKKFSTNDVARLFMAEGLHPPSPYSKWDIKMIEELYRKAKNPAL